MKIMGPCLKLTDKQECFCQEYLKDLNATQAATRAGYSEKTANEQGARLLANVSVAARINELMKSRSKRAEVTSDDILHELKKLAFVDISKAYNENGDLLSVHEMPEDIRKAIAGIDVFTEVQYFDKGQTDENGDKVKEVIGKTKKLKMNDKLKALELLGKHLKLFTEKVEHSGTIDLKSISDEELDRRYREVIDRAKKGDAK